MHDLAADLVPAADVHHAGVHYTDVPVRCRGNGEFHPKLVVIAGPERAIVSIGSGNVTASGWHHNGELWTTLAADSGEWPDTFHELADWLLELPRFLYIDRFGAGRIAAAAATLTRHPARSTGPRLVHNLHTPITEQLPAPTGQVTDLLFASPFVDRQAAALRRLSTHFAAEQITFAVTANATADPDVMVTWADEGGADLYAIADTRYYHGKLVQWSDGDGTHALVGSANTTAAAMLRTTGDKHGNCELALLCQIGDGDLAPPLGESLDDADAVRKIVAEPQPETARDPETPRLLRAILDGSGVLVTVVADSPGAIRDLLLENQEPHALTLTGSDERVHRLRAEVTDTGGSLCHVALNDGSMIGPVRVTDPIAVVIRPGTVSPLEDHHLTDVLGDRRLSERLFEALKKLAAVRPTAPDASRAGTGQESGEWRQAAERTVGSALVRLALGYAAITGTAEGSDEGFDAGDVVDETDNDDDGIDLFDDEDEHDTGLGDPLTASGDPVTGFLTDPVTAARLARRIDTLLPQTPEWHTGALLALLRVAFLVAAGGGWPTLDQFVSVLLRVAEATPEDDDVKEARNAAVLVGLAILASEVTGWDDTTDAIVDAFERCQALAAVDPADIDNERVTHYCADLHIGFGVTLTADSLIDASPYLLTSSLVERAIESIGTEYRDLTLAAPRLLRIRSGGNPYGAAMRLLTRVAHLAPVAVYATSTRGQVYAVWQPKILTLQRYAANGNPITGSRHRLAVGPGAHIEASPPGTFETWRGSLPADLADQLRQANLLSHATPA
ncbi:hypothetical protein [Actinoplanes couchii]|uniref:hypothetical protein n=1 Tax=Actinoplanes couchii TaxID=403638 RepID=UPI00194063AE|nr:hypothetical protein [Actinoplanes couchii]